MVARPQRPFWRHGLCPMCIHPQGVRLSCPWRTVRLRCHCRHDHQFALVVEDASLQGLCERPVWVSVPPCFRGSCLYPRQDQGLLSLDRESAPFGAFDFELGPRRCVMCRPSASYTDSFFGRTRRHTVTDTVHDTDLQYSITICVTYLNRHNLRLYAERSTHITEARVQTGQAHQLLRIVVHAHALADLVLLTVPRLHHACVRLFAHELSDSVRDFMCMRTSFDAVAGCQRHWRSHRSQ